MITLARMNWGRWIADCPADGCADARQLTPGQTGIVCAAGHPSTVQWPSEAAVIGITDALAKRPREGDRNWFPKGHPLAEAHSIETDLTPAQLDEQTAAQEAIGQVLDRDRRQLLTLLAQHGLAVGPDGTIRGRLQP